MDQGIKKDVGKNRLDLIPVECIDAIGKVLTFGAAKYHDNSWREGMNYSRIYAAAQRHLQAFWGEGSDTDNESKLPHLFHALCNISFLIAYEENKERYQTFDDRVGSHIETAKPFPNLTKMTHPEACTYLKPGMRVKVLGKATTRDRGWENSWSDTCMDKAVYMIYTILTIHPSGVMFKDSDGFGFPAFVLEIVDEGK